MYNLKVYMDTAEASSSSSSSSSDEESNFQSDQAKDGNYATKPDAMGNHVTICDINQAMLDVGKKRAKALGYTSGKLCHPFTFHKMWLSLILPVGILSTGFLHPLNR